MKRAILFLILLCTALPVLAQDDTLPREAALAAAQQRLGTRAQTWTYTILLPTTQSSLTCPLAPAGDLGREVIPYRYVLAYATGEYVVYASSDGAVVVLCDEKFDLPVQVPTSVPVDAVPVATEVVTPDAALANACLLSAAGAFANVRANPNREAPQVGQIFSGQPYAVLAQSSRADDRWYFITPGWVSATVATISGAECSLLVVDDTRLGTGAGVTAPTTDTNISQTLSLYACPPGFAGYLEPRIRIGTATARVGSGGLPNVIRSQPIVNDSIGARLGTIQPNRTIDQVINGPACSGGYVWWLVSVDGVQGWTAESNIAEDSYFLESLVAPTPASTPNATTQPSGNGIGVGIELERREDTRGAQLVAITLDNDFALASDVIVGATGNETFVVAEYALDVLSPRFTDTGMALPTRVTGIQSLGNGRIAVSDTNSLFVFNKLGDQYVQETAFTGLFTDQEVIVWSFSDDGRLYVTAQRTPAGFEVVMRAVTSPEPLWTTDLLPEFDVFKLGFNPSLQTVAAFGFNGMVLLDAITGIQQTSLSNATEQFGMLDFAFNPVDDTQLLTSICKRVDDTQINGGCVAGEITLWSIPTSSILGVVETNAGNPLHVAYSPDGAYIYIADSSGALVVRDNGGNLILEQQLSDNINISINDFALSPNGQSIVITTSDQNLVWYEVDFAALED